MHSFAPGYLDRQLPTHGVLRSVATVHDYRGREELFRQQSPEILDTLRHYAVISSILASNRIEGIVAPPSRVRSLVGKRTEPRNRSEQEIAGYRDVLDTIHTNWAHIPLTTGSVLQLHRDLFRYSPQPGGLWKTADNQIVERDADGAPRLRFQPTAAWQTPEAMESLHLRLRDALERGAVEPLLLIAAYVLDFLCIHPFLDGNGRMARLLTLLLLYRAGFGVGRFISLEQIVDDSRQNYYDALGASSEGWHEGSHALVPWWEYFLGIMIDAYRTFERRVGETRAPRGAKAERVRQAIEQMPSRFRFGDLLEAAPGVSQPTIRRVLVEMRQAGAVKCLGTGRSAEWEKVLPTA